MRTPDEILENISKNESKKSLGKLKIFFGMCAGVGKTYSMLLHAKELVKDGKNVVVGYIETHGRKETEDLLEGLVILPRKKITYKGFQFEEFDIEKSIECKPEYILVDELAHTNIEGSTHPKRYQDVQQLLELGINVLTTINVQHIESRSKTVEQITGAPIFETVPDSIIELANDIEVVDIPVEELLKRLSEGKIYVPEKAKIAAQNFFKMGNIISLREMALRFTAEKVEGDLVDYMSEKNIKGPWKAGDKLLVAVGPSPFSAELVRWTRRMAYTLKAQWYAVYVDIGLKESDISKETLEKNLRLAKELGAEVVISADTDLVNGLLQIARRLNVAQIVIGKPAQYNLLNLIKRDNYIDRLIHESGEIDIYIVRPQQIDKKVKKNRVINFSTSLKEYLISTLSVMILSLLCFPFSEVIGYQSVGLILLLNLLVMPFYVGRGAIFLSAILNALIWDFFFIPPIFTLAIGTLQDVLTLLLNLVIAITSGVLSTRIRKQQKLVQKREKNTVALLNFTKELSSCKSKAEVISIAIKQIEVIFNIHSTFFDENIIPITGLGDTSIFIPKEINIAKWSLERNVVTGKFTDNLPDSAFQYRPVVTNRKSIGVLCLHITSKFSIEDESLLNNIITQLAGTYEKEEAAEQINKIIIESESRKLYDTLLDSISHEFRTPIAVISGSATSLLEQNIIHNPKLVKNFADEIYIATKRLNLLVENLLDITRLESGKLKLNKGLYNINEVIAETLIQLKEISHNHKIITDIKATNPTSMIDYGFINQALFNILHNALIYTCEGTTITISTHIIGKLIHISIVDDGNGLDNESIDRLFEKFYRPQGTKTGGTGLGLSISKGFIESHGGSITVKNNEPSGLIFDIFLPLYEQ